MSIGRIFKRQYKDKDGAVKESPSFSIAYPHGGRERVESARTDSETKARALLKRRIEEIGRGEFSPKQERVFLPDLVELLKADYRANAQRSLKEAEWRIKPLLAYFDGWRVRTITYDKISGYAQHRLTEVATATVNGELRYLRRLFRLGIKHGRIATMPIIELLKGENRRQGFIDPGDFAVLLGKFEDSDVFDLCDFLYRTGWRVSTGTALEWRDIDFEAKTVTMRGEISKNKEPIVLPFFAGIEEILLRRKELRQLSCPFVFSRGGRKIRDFRSQWCKATTAAGYVGLLVHDLCRSAARNLSRAGVSETVASRFVNRKTLSIYKLYRVVDTEDLRLAGESLNRYLEASTSTKDQGAQGRSSFASSAKSLFCSSSAAAIRSWISLAFAGAKTRNGFSKWPKLISTYQPTSK